jgi:hypothetical protein
MTTTTRTLMLASLLCAGCQIHLHVSLPPEELARLRAAAEVRQTDEESPPPPRARVTTAERQSVAPVEREHLATSKSPAHESGEPCPLDEAQTAYVDGDYVGALQKAVHSNHAGWRIIAATACALHDEAWVTRAVGNLNPLERTWLSGVCRRQGLILTNLYTEHPRILRTVGLDSSDSDDQD